MASAKVPFPRPEAGCSTLDCCCQPDGRHAVDVIARACADIKRAAPNLQGWESGGLEESPADKSKALFEPRWIQLAVCRQGLGGRGPDSLGHIPERGQKEAALGNCKADGRTSRPGSEACCSLVDQ